MVALGRRQNSKFVEFSRPPCGSLRATKNHLSTPHLSLKRGVLKIFCCAAELAPPPGGGQGNQLTRGPLDLFLSSFTLSPFFSFCVLFPFSFFFRSLLPSFSLYPFSCSFPLVGSPTLGLCKNEYVDVYVYVYAYKYIYIYTYVYV